MAGKSAILQAGGVKRLGPIDMQRSSKTGSNKARKPDGNSTKQLAWPIHVVRRELLAVPSGRNIGGTMGIFTLDVSGVGRLPCIRVLGIAECQLVDDLARLKVEAKARRILPEELGPNLRKPEVQSVRRKWVLKPNKTPSLVFDMMCSSVLGCCPGLRSHSEMIRAH